MQSKPFWWFWLCFMSCAHAPLHTTTTPTTFDARRLTGTWFIVATNFPRWLDGTRTDPRFVYSRLRIEDGEVKCDDLVLARSGNTEERIEGVDTQHPQVNTHFTWRGNGLLALFSSEWDIVAIAPDDSWAVIAFSATLFTPAGLDIISRTSTLDDSAIQRALAVIAADPTLSTIGAKLQRLPLRQEQQSEE